MCVCVFVFVFVFVCVIVCVCVCNKLLEVQGSLEALQEERHILVQALADQKVSS